jgi:hypothetical protein
VHRILVGKPAGKRPLEEKGVCRWIILQWILQIGWGSMVWIDLAQDRDL